MGKYNGQEETAPIQACLFDRIGEIQFKDAEADEQRFSIIGYSGEIIPNHWYWGNVAFDLTGMKFAKKRTPVLEEHSTDRRIGFSDKQEISDKVLIQGPFLDNETAVAIFKDMKKGFPMEASLRVLPSVIEDVEQGASVEVNGKTLKGPGAVFRKSTIEEVSICVFGADANTESRAFNETEGNIEFSLINKNNNNSERVNTMAGKETEFTQDILKAEHPKIHEQVFSAGMAEGEKTERDCFKELQDACGGDNDLLVECYSAGKKPIEAVQMANEKLKAKNAELMKNQAENTTGNTATETTKTDPASAEFIGDQKANKTKIPESESSEDQLKEKFKNSLELQKEFVGKVENYLAFIRNNAAGNVKMKSAK